MRLKRIAAMLMAAVMAVSLAACGGNADTNTESSQNPQENAEAQAVHLNLAESWGFEYFYTIITPEVSSSSYDITYYLTSFYDTLFEYNSEGEVVGVLAEDWSMSEDGMVYTFQIKQGVKFSDGSDLTAEDVAKSILAVPVNLGQYNGSYGRLSTIIEDAVATDEYTVELHLTQPYYNTLRELCLANPFGIVSSEQFNDDLTAKQESFRSATYGTGPYMYAGDNDGQTWNFVRNPNYWGDAPEVDSFSIKYIPDNDAKILAMQNGEVDFLSGIKYLNFVCDIFGVPQAERQERIHKYAGIFELTGDLAEPISAYSHGMKQKLAIISALVHSPKLIIMDEPFVGLDPVASHKLKGLMREHCDAGGAIFFSTHVLEVAEKLCDMVAIIKGGRLIKSGTMDEVRGDDSLEDVFLELEEE